MSVTTLKRPAHTKLFRVGQLWETREGKWRLRIEAITNHPDTPVIARCQKSGLVDCYGLTGAWECDGNFREFGEVAGLDLVTLIEDAPPSGTPEWDRIEEEVG